MKVLALKSICILLLGYFAFACLHHPESRVDPYDASYASVAARNLAFHHRYGVWNGDTFVACPCEVTTGPGILLPLAAAYWCFGDWLFMPGVVTTVLTVGMLGFVWLIAVPRDSRHSSWHYFSLLVAVLAVLATTAKEGEHRGFCAPYGDVLAGLLLATAILALARTFRGEAGDFWPMLSGVCAALALNTKFLTIMPLASWAAFIVVSSWFRWIPRRAAVIGLAAFAATEGGFIIFSMLQFETPRAYLASLRGFYHFFRKGGSGLDGVKPPLAELFPLSARSYFCELGWCGPVLLLPLLLSPICLYRLARGRGSADGWLGVSCAMQILPVLAWFFFGNNRHVVRQIIPLLVLLPFACHFLLSDAWRHVRSWRGQAAIVGVWPAGLIVAGLLSPYPTWDLPGPSYRSSLSTRTADLVKFAADVKALRREQPDARFFGAGWWRHWDVQLATGEKGLSDLLERPPRVPPPGQKNHDYLIMSDYFNLEQSPVVRSCFDCYRDDIVFAHGVFQLYRLKPAAEVKATASYANHEVGDAFATLKNGFVLNATPLSWWDHRGTEEWVQYEFPAKTRVSTTEIRWHDESGSGGLCLVPASWRLLYKDGGDWKAVEKRSEPAFSPNACVRVTFQPVSTTAVRLVVQLQRGMSGGVAEWRVR
jgi:hypothetical protein